MMHHIGIIIVCGRQAGSAESVSNLFGFFLAKLSIYRSAPPSTWLSFEFSNISLLSIQSEKAFPPFFILAFIYTNRKTHR